MAEPAAYLAGCLLGLGLLAWAADELVLGSSALAARVGVPALMVGVVVIGFGTSAPELLVSGLAAAGGSPAIGVGTVIGSNIANLTLVLGVAALVAPIAVRAGVIRREVPVAFLATAGFGLAVQGGLSRLDGLLLLGGLAASLVLLLWWAATARAAEREPGLDPPVAEFAGELAAEVDELLAPHRRGALLTMVVRAGWGLLGTLLGAQALVWGAAGIARAASVPEGFIGLTVVAIGTSLPELVTAVQAARRGETDLIVGNLLGSNLFNALAVGGTVALIRPGAAVGRALSVTGVLVMLAVCALALVFMWRRFRVVRWEGAVLVAVYLVALPLMAGG